MKRSFAAIPLLLAMVATTALAAAPADIIRTRVSGYRALGAAFKSANDDLRRGEFGSPGMKRSAQQIALASREQYRWFPRGSGPRAGVKTAAKADIWVRGKEFRIAQDALASQAAAFERAVATGDEAAVRLEARKLGGTCKNCHDQFRTSDD